ncbi:early endosome antigen 1 [Hydra vulgaris]|uniref:Early endosome antigen 1 n=1 Tax=Hydra vulgaris TaxID=6087 RepID=A0ABM4BCL7_HYDVU
MNYTNSMKVSVNGKKYFISGIQKYTSHKEILCAIAKVTQSSNREIEGEEGKPQKVFNTVNAIKRNVSIEKAIQVKQDYVDNQNNSIETFNTSAIDTGIRKKLCKKNQSKERPIQSSKKKSRKAEDKHLKRSDQVVTFHNSTGERKILKVKNKKSSNLEYTVKVSQKLEKENRFRKSQQKHKNSLEISNNDFNRPVFSENFQIQKLNKKVKKKTRKKTAWMNDFKNSTHIYYVDGKSNLEEDQKMMSETTLNYQVEKDSGLPSPDFNSCESQDQIKANRFSISHINIEQLFLDQLASIENERCKPPDNNTDVNKTFIKINNDKKVDSLYIQTEENNIYINAIDLSSKNNIDTSLSKATQNDNVNISSKYENLKQLLPTDSFTDQPCEDFLLKIEPSFRIQNIPNTFLDLNENVVGHTDQSKNILFNEQTISDSTENYMMHDKKKVFKTDISHPVLMSPETIRKQKSLRKLQAVFGEDVSSTLLQMADKSNLNFIEKNNELNKKKKKVNRTKILKQNIKVSKEKSNEPEYVSKNLFHEKPASEVLEYNVFRKKDKSKKSKPVKQKKEFIKVELLNNPAIACDNDVNTCSEKMSGHLPKCEIDQNRTSDEYDKNMLKICSNNKKTSESQHEEMDKVINTNKQNGDDRLSSEIDVLVPVIESDTEINSLEQQLIEATLSLLYIEEQTLDLNLIISYLTDELQSINKAEKQSLDEIERIIFKDLKDILGLLKSVTDLNTYQRQEMVTNMNVIDKLDQELRVKKAAIENLRSGSWRTNSYCAPRSLLRKSKKKVGGGLYDKKFSFV